MTVESAAQPDFSAYQGVPSNVLNSIRAASRRTGVDFSYLMEKAAAESSFDTHCQAKTSSARGLYQFIDQTWLNMVERHGEKHGLGHYADALKDGTLDEAGKEELLALRDDPRLSALMAAEYSAGNKDRLEAALNRETCATDLYLAHFLGGGGATRFLEAMQADGNAEAARLMPKAAAANKAVFYDGERPRSLTEIYDRFAAKFGASNAAVTDVSPVTVAQSDMPAPAHKATAAGHARAFVRPVPQSFSAPPSPNGNLGADAILFLASLELLPDPHLRA